MDNTSEPQSLTDVTLTVRVIKSFRYRTTKSLIFRHVNLVKTSVWNLKEMSRQAILIEPGWKPFRTVHLNTLKLYTKAHGAKTANLIINLDHDEWILENDARTLAQLGFEHETEVSFFNRKDYEEFKLNPETSWCD